ncbi:bacillithiol biosynthesis deacetylase BshB1 [Petropleomorpha daqingensis]|uniref:Bacillithiol biosynthesis deacetylase BshB1 n=1 Tax=Petropleomorpha daqingensis TaxID=2026353 RepID=A0A853CG44_9ACTN|nr:bacillithiol biosynthesis deacetylase BshB1 [Petropleomorpha daqingensis]
MSVDVLAVGAHPDDVEVGCGGVLALCAQAGMRVAIADLTAGELGTRGTRELRADEARRAGDILGVQSRTTLDLPDGGLGPEHRAAVVGLLRDLRPRLVLAPYHLDDRHPDHAAAGRLVRDAAFLAGVAKWGDGDPHRTARVHHYMLHTVFEPTFVVDVTPVWEQRTAAIAAFESQFSAAPGDRRTAIDGGGFLELLAARARVFGAMIGAAWGEPFSCTGPLGLDRLPDLPSGEGPVYRSFI